jgi:hypothetical protein
MRYISLRAMDHSQEWKEGALIRERSWTRTRPSLRTDAGFTSALMDEVVFHKCTVVSMQRAAAKPGTAGSIPNWSALSPPTIRVVIRPGSHASTGLEHRSELGRRLRSALGRLRKTRHHDAVERLRDLQW